MVAAGPTTVFCFNPHLLLKFTIKLAGWVHLVGMFLILTELQSLAYLQSYSALYHQIFLFTIDLPCSVALASFSFQLCRFTAYAKKQSTIFGSSLF